MIAREGLMLILAGVAVTSLLLASAARLDSLILASLSALLALLTVFTTFFFRDPPRHFEGDSRALVAPADGRILGVETVSAEGFPNGQALKVSIFLSVLDVHINRIPTNAVVKSVDFHQGKFFSAFKDEASRDNQRTDVMMETTDGMPVLVKQITGSIARRVICHLKPGDTVKAGERFGLIRFGSRTELWVPLGCDILVAEGDRVKGGQTIVGTLPARKAVATSDGGDRRLDVEL